MKEFNIKITDTNVYINGKLSYLKKWQIDFEGMLDEIDKDN